MKRKELTEKGPENHPARTRQGRETHHRLRHRDEKRPWEFPHRGRLTNEMKATHPVQKRDYPYNEFKPDWWVNDLECPYTEVKRFDWYRGFHVGGKSLMWGRQSYRWSDFDFEANAKEGVAVDWPIRYADIAPWYDYVETFRGYQRLPRRVAPTARRQISAADGTEHRGKRRGRPH